MSGVMASTPVDGVPTKSGISISDQLGGQFGLAGILAALNARETTGRGVHLDIAMQDCSAWATQTRWNSPDPRGLPAMIRAADGLVAVEQDAAQETSGLSCPEFVEKLSKAGIDAAPVLSVKQVMEHPQTVARGLLKTVPTADGDAWMVLGSPMRLLSTPAEVRSAMPKLGFIHAELAEEFGLPVGDAPMRLRA
jgi:crotonobetainyl-CoA:carnitine CoA-transferase CaiB-like acyl-CoA transferase